MIYIFFFSMCSNLTNKYNPQEHKIRYVCENAVQILPINTILKNKARLKVDSLSVQILPINTILKNVVAVLDDILSVQILPINTILKNKVLYQFILLEFKSYQ